MSPRRVPVEPATATATAPLSGSPVSGIQAYVTGPVPAGVRRPALPFQAVQSEPLEEAPTRQAIVPLEIAEPEPEPEPEPRTTRRDWPRTLAVASVVVMLLVTAAQVAVELRSRAAIAESASMPPFPEARLAAPMPSSAPLAEAVSAVPAPPSAVPAASAASVRPRAPVVRPRPQVRGDVVDPWGK